MPRKKLNPEETNTEGSPKKTKTQSKIKKSETSKTTKKAVSEPNEGKTNVNNNSNNNSKVKEYEGKKNLFIVESPAKSKKIQYYLGKNFLVKASVGHIRDLKKSELSIDVNNNFEPTYQPLANKNKVISDLRKYSKESDIVWLAPDEDREGEAIAWHLKEVLNLPEEKIRRITFNEITKNAIMTAVNNPRDIDMDLVDAQQTRRILDRLVGFELSPVLWKHFKENLSAGRVQSVVIKMIYARENEINNFISEDFYKVEAVLTPKNAITDVINPKKSKTKSKSKSKSDSEEDSQENLIITAVYNKNKEDEDDTTSFLEEIKTGTFKIRTIEKKTELKHPPPPYTTSTLQQDGTIKIHVSSKQIMAAAQRLYETGLITYMRTDSVSLSNMALGMIKKEVINRYGEEKYKFRNYTTKSKGAQEAHGCIRPTNMKISHPDDILLIMIVMMKIRMEKYQR